MKTRYFFTIIFSILAAFLFAQETPTSTPAGYRGPGYGFPITNIGHNPPDTGMVVVTKVWRGRPAPFWEYPDSVSFIGGGSVVDSNGMFDAKNQLGNWEVTAYYLPSTHSGYIREKGAFKLIDSTLNQYDNEILFEAVGSAGASSPPYVAMGSGVKMPRLEITGDTTEAGGTIKAGYSNDTYNLPVERPDSAGLAAGTYIMGVDEIGALAGTGGWLPLPNYENTLYVNETGNNSTARPNQYFFPFADPWAASDSLESGDVEFISPGDYTYSGPYSTNAVAAQSPTKESVSIIAQGKVGFDFTGVSSTIFPGFSNATSNNPDAKDMDVSIWGPDMTINASRGSSSLVFPFGYYGRNTALNARFKSLVVTGGRTFGLHLGAWRSNVEVDTVDITGGVGLSVWRNPPSEEGVAMTRNISVKVQYMEVDAVADQSGAIRYQTFNKGDEYKDSLSVININIGHFHSPLNSHEVYLFNPSEMDRTNFTLNIGKITEATDMASSFLINASNGDFSGPATFDTCANSFIKWNFGEVTTSRKIFSDRFGSNTDFLAFDNSSVNLTINKGVFSSSGAEFYSDNTRLLNNSVFTVNCKDCQKENPASTEFIELGANTYDADTSGQYVFSGRWSVNSASEVMHLTAFNNVLLRDCLFENTTGSGLITSTIPITVYVCNSNVNQSNVGSNVTIVDICDQNPNGIFDPSNNNDTVRVSQTYLSGNWDIDLAGSVLEIDDGGTNYARFSDVQGYMRTDSSFMGVFSAGPGVIENVSLLTAPTTGEIVMGKYPGVTYAHNFPVMQPDQYGAAAGTYYRVVNENGDLAGNNGWMRPHISGSGTPVGSVTPEFLGQEYLDTTGTVWYKSTGLTNTDWVALN